MSDERPTLVSTIKNYSTQLFGFIRSRVKSEEEAEDVLQEVWYQLSRVVDLEEIQNISAWLYRVTRNNLTDRFRKKSPQFFDPTNPESMDWFQVLTDDAETPEESFFKELFWEELHLALNELPEAQRNTFIRNELEDETLQQIADRTGTPLKTVISRKRYAVNHLKSRLKELYNELTN